MEQPQSSDVLQTVTTILAIGSVLCPIIFGFALWKLAQIFATKKEFMELKADLEALTSNSQRLAVDIATLMERTNKHKNHE